MRGIPKVKAMDQQQHGSTRIAVLTALRRWWRDERGVTAIEYGLLASLIVIAALGGISTLGQAVFDLFIQWTNAVIAVL